MLQIHKFVRERVLVIELNATLITNQWKTLYPAAAVAQTNIVLYVLVFHIYAHRALTCEIDRSIDNYKLLHWRRIATIEYRSDADDGDDNNKTGNGLVVCSAQMDCMHETEASIDGGESGVEWGAD